MSLGNIEVRPAVAACGALISLVSAIVYITVPVEVREWPTKAIDETGWNLKSESVDGREVTNRSLAYERAWFDGRSFCLREADEILQWNVVTVPLEAPSLPLKGDARRSNWTFTSTRYPGRKDPYQLEVSYTTASGQKVERVYHRDVVVMATDLWRLRTGAPMGIFWGIVLMVFAIATGDGGDWSIGGGSSGGSGGGGGFGSGSGTPDRPTGYQGSGP